MTDRSLVLDALAAWDGERKLGPDELLPARPDLHSELVDGMARILQMEAAVGTPEPSEPDEPTDPHQPPPEPDDLLELLDPPTEPGDLGVVAGYRVSAVLGYGGMGAVFAAERDGRMLAVKLVRGGRVSRSAVERFKREADALRAVRHPGVVPAVAVDEHRGQPVLVMPRLIGETLDARLRRPPLLQVNEVVRLAGELADALQAVHATGYVHRDLKPSNVWLDDRPRLIDFGLARLASGADRVTAPGHFVGTPAYMAPEQAQGGDIDPRADLFALGCLIYRAATGVAAFAGRSLPQVLVSVQTDHPPPPAQVRPDLPAGLSELVVHLLKKHPDDRPQSAAEVVRRVHALAFDMLRPAPAPVEAMTTEWPALANGLFGGQIARGWVTPAGKGAAVAELVLATPGHPGLIAFGADGMCRVVYPGDDGKPSDRRLSVRAAVTGLPPGFNAVAMVVGPDPLATGRGWGRRALGGEPPWRPRPDPSKGVWTHHGGRTIGEWESSRQMAVVSDSPAAAVLGRLAGWLAGRPGVADVAVIGFTV